MNVVGVAANTVSMCLPESVTTAVFVSIPKAPGLFALAFSIFSKGLIWFGVGLCALGIALWVSVAIRSLVYALSTVVIGVPLIGVLLAIKTPGDLLAKRRARV